MACKVSLQMDIETYPRSHTSQLTNAVKRLFNKPKKNVVQLMDFVGSVNNRLNDTMNSSCSSENEEVNEIDQPNAVASGMCINKLFVSLRYYLGFAYEDLV